MGTPESTSSGRAILGRAWGLLGALLLTLGFFLVLPLIQAITAQGDADTIVQPMDLGAFDPPDDPPEMEEPEPEEEEPEEEPPQMEQDVQPLSLDQLDLALNPGMGDGWFGAEFALDLNLMGGGAAGDLDSIFSLADLDQKPRVTYQPAPVIDAKIRKSAPGTVYVLFVVDVDGRVQDPKVQKSTDPVFERSAVAAVKKWRFEPGKRNGEAVQFRMRVPITFPKS